MVKKIMLLSRSKINLSKSHIVGISSMEKKVNNLANKFGLLVVSWPLIYLGLPLVDDPRSSNFLPGTRKN